MEVEIKSLPILHTSIIVGAAFMNAQDLDTGRTIQPMPQRTYDVGIQFDKDSLKAQLKGHYIYWNAPASFNGKYDSMIVDLHIAKELITHHDQSLAVYADVHNIFNGSQYLFDVFKNPARWFEAGVRYAF
jgi:vitamin B12 transporter